MTDRAGLGGMSNLISTYTSALTRAKMEGSQKLQEKSVQRDRSLGIYQ